MNAPAPLPATRERLIHALYEAAELEHNLMCTYLYAAFSLKSGTEEGLTADEAAAVEEWRRAILGVAIDEMGHLAAVWNITSALGGSPRFGRGNFPLDPGALPAGVVVKLAPFADEVLQHFIFLERPHGSTERDGVGFEPEINFRRSVEQPRLTPMPMDYDTVGEFYETLETRLCDFAQRKGESVAFCGDPLLQLSHHEVELKGAEPVICIKTASAALKAIIEQGEGAPSNSAGSHFSRFIEVREKLAALKAKNPDFTPAHPAAWNPLLRRPVRAGNRVWIENEEAARTVDAANTGYMLMMRLLAFSYLLPRGGEEKPLAIDLAIGLMRAVSYLAERAARLPAGPANPDCNAGMSFTAVRDSSPFPPGNAARRFFVERFAELSEAVTALAQNGDKRVQAAARLVEGLSRRAVRGFGKSGGEKMDTKTADPQPSAAEPAGKPTANGKDTPPTPRTVDGVDYIEGEKLTLIYEGKKCIHSRFCVTWAPQVFMANVQGPWIKPDAMDVERLAEIAHVCTSGAIRYARKDGRPAEPVPPVNLIATREGGPYAVRADIRLDGEKLHYRATLCRCGASKNKPFCDQSHHDVEFDATGEPPSGKTDMLPVRDGPLAIDPEPDGPLQVRGNLEITSGTGRVVARVTSARLCRCGGSSTKPFCDGTHARIGFRST
ncbi:MAG TPA: ferritin-like domain-containing protein, partial [Alphaproteobacteria bacterium]|nr:ferritin-like domain-containing protein [Alphaproteobacteria bacterium]